MKIEINPDDVALAEVADLHRAALPGSLISKLGLAYSRAFYRFAASSPSEAVFVARGDDAVVIGGAVLSLKPASLSKRLLFGTPLVFHAIPRVWLSCSIAADYLRGRFSASEGVANDELPEVVAIFTRIGDRSHGVGKKMLAAIESHLNHLTVHKYVVRTDDRPDNRAIDFYKSIGFETVGAFYANGNRFQLMSKEIK